MGTMELQGQSQDSLKLMLSSLSWTSLGVLSGTSSLMASLCADRVTRQLAQLKIVLPTLPNHQSSVRPAESLRQLDQAARFVQRLYCHLCSQSCERSWWSIAGPVDTSHTLNWLLGSDPTTEGVCARLAGLQPFLAPVVVIQLFTKKGYGHGERVVPGPICYDWSQLDFKAVRHCTSIHFSGCSPLYEYTCMPEACARQYCAAMPDREWHTGVVNEICNRYLCAKVIAQIGNLDRKADSFERTVQQALAAARDAGVSASELAWELIRVSQQRLLTPPSEVDFGLGLAPPTFLEIALSPRGFHLAAFGKNLSRIFWKLVCVLNTLTVEFVAEARLPPNDHKLLLEGIMDSYVSNGLASRCRDQVLSQYLASLDLGIAKKHIQVLLSMWSPISGSHSAHTLADVESNPDKRSPVDFAANRRAAQLCAIEPFFTDVHWELLENLGQGWIRGRDVIIAVSKKAKQVARVVSTRMLVALLGAGCTQDLGESHEISKMRAAWPWAFDIERNQRNRPNMNQRYVNAVMKLLGAQVRVAPENLSSHREALNELTERNCDCCAGVKFAITQILDRIDKSLD